ncbi:LacI family DNA-binding transcriptional regulator [Gammaproteobacteria bacterium AS21]
MNKLTIKDIAALAKVSTATVDRVLNRREGVKAATVEKVMKTIEQMRYTPSTLAASTKGKMRLAFVLPQGRNTFMKQLALEVEYLEDSLTNLSVSVRVVETQFFDGDSLAATLRALKGSVDGVAVVALDHPSVQEAINDLVEAGIPVVTIVSDMPSSKRHYHLGIDNFGAGRTAASLMGRFLGAKTGKIAIIAGSLSLRDHVERRLGFEQVMMQEYSHQQILPISESEDNFAKVEQLSNALLKKHPDLVGIYNVGAGNRGVVNALQRSAKANEVVFIAHELTQFSRRALVEGVIDALINQNSGHEARSAARVLWALLSNQEINQAQERIRTEILMRHNLP